MKVNPNNNRGISAQRRFWRRETADLIAVVLLLGVFTLAVMRKDYFFISFLESRKWFAYIGFLVYAFSRNSRTLTLPRGLTAALFICLPLVGLISSVTFAYRIDEALQRIVSFWALFFLAFIVPVPPDTYARLLIWARALKIVSGGVVLLSLTMAFDPSNYIQHRFAGCMYTPNFLAGFASFVIVGTLSTILGSLPKMRFFHLAALAGGLYCLIASGARADLVGTVCSALVIALHILNRRNFTLVAGGAVVLALLGLSAPAIFNTFAPSQIGGREFRLQDRTDIWAKQIESFQGSPWIGWGFEFANPERGFGRAGGEGSYTDLLSAVGVLGAVPFFSGLALGLFRYHRFLSRSSTALSFAQKQSYLFVDGLSLSVCILVTSIAEPTMATVGTPMAMFVWVTLAAGSRAKPIRAFLSERRAAWVPGRSSMPLQAAR